MGTIARKRAEPPLLIGLDIGSSGTRGRVFDAAGRTLNKLEGRVRHQATSGADGTVVYDADAILDEVVQIVDGLLAAAGKRAAAIAAVACDTFASSLVGVDARGRARTPVYTYADSRPAAQVETLARLLDENAVQQRTGCRFHASYLPARFLWLRETAPEILAGVKHWLSLGEYLYLKLLGQRAASFSTAAWSGLLNRHTLTWDSELLAALPVERDQLSPLHDTSEPLQGLTRKYQARWPQLKTTRWFSAVADGYVSNVGSDATDPATYALSLATSAAVRVLLDGSPPEIPAGLWCYRVNRRQSLLGGALNDGGRAIGWLRGLLNLPPRDELSALLQAPPSPETPTVLPFLTGERSPGWAAHATASFSHMDLHTTPGALFRGMVEAIGLRLALITQQMLSVAPNAKSIVASGGAAEDLPEWLQILADITALPVTQSLEGQSTLRGTALIALDVIAPAAPREPAETGSVFLPAPQNGEAYGVARDRQAAAYQALVAGA